jgi:hypothetical protein
MRVRKVDANGDRVFGGDQAAFWRNVPEAVAQVVESRLNMWVGDWFLDLSDGTPYEQQVLGRYTAHARDAVLQARILTTPGVNALKSYSSALDGREYSVSARIETAYSLGVTPGANGAYPLGVKVELGR